MLLNGMAYVPKRAAGGYLLNSSPKTLMGDLAEPFGCNRRRTHEEHTTCVAVVAILNNRDVNVHDITSFHDLGPRNAMADLMIDRGAYRLGVGRIARRTVIQWGRNGLLDIHHVVMA